jgi:N-methylhydantoinase B
MDAVELEVLRNKLLAVGQEMSLSLQRSAYSTNIKTRADFSCALFDEQYRTVVQAFNQPGHLGSLTQQAAGVLREYGPENLEEGDALLCNDPYGGGTHLPDCTLISPIVLQGRAIGYVGNLAHHVDIGGRVPGSVAGDSTEIYQEGLIVPPVKIIRRGEVNFDIFRLVMRNVRAQRENAGDFRAQFAANKLAVRRYLELVEKYGLPTIRGAIDAILDYTERRVRAELAKLPRGSYEAEEFLDGDGVVDEPVRLAVRVELQGDRVSIDLSDCAPQTRGPINAPYPVAFSGVTYPLICLTDPDIAPNDGVYRPITVKTRRGTVVDPIPPAPVVGCWEICMRLAESVFKALAGADPQRVPAGSKGCMCNLAYGAWQVDGRSYAYYETVGGGYGARYNKDGIDGVQPHIQNTENSPVEELETTLPVRIVRYSLIADSGGPGTFRGGLGIRRDLQFPGHRAVFSIVSDRAKFPAWALQGGQPGRLAQYVVNFASPHPRALNSKCSVTLAPDDIVSIQTPGGGGYGAPFMRDPALVLDDVLSGKVTPQEARTAYGVAIDVARRVVDAAETARLRR